MLRLFRSHISNHKILLRKLNEGGQDDGIMQRAWEKMIDFYKTVVEDLKNNRSLGRRRRMRREILTDIKQGMWICIEVGCLRIHLVPTTVDTVMNCIKLTVFFYLVCEAIGTAATPGLLCQPRVIVKMIVEK
jgi:hypothetical protein